MVHLYVIRHGETEWNAQKRMQGRLDSDLTAKGIHHAKLLGRKLASTEFVAVISSPSRRTTETAKLIIGNHLLPFKTDERLMEIQLGNWQGKTLDEIQAMDPERYDCYRYHPRLFKIDEGEAFHDVKVRLEGFLQSIEDTYQSGNLLIVTHGVVIKTLQMICKNKLFDQFWEEPDIEGTSLSIVNVEDGKKEFLLEGDISHLTGVSIEE